ncbi:hypothetical protein E2C01_006619 [Portunus trituberculatus]|uniref:Uncharacterized protein n=1 Tax=Portunus trituberculatus TaxID=210409 RepID=A0A5B7CWU5_PORTR|nr:hypothetical protein [Portunus trituberculatus]
MGHLFCPNTRTEGKGQAGVMQGLVSARCNPTSFVFFLSAAASLLRAFRLWHAYLLPSVAVSMSASPWAEAVISLVSVLVTLPLPCAEALHSLAAAAVITVYDGRASLFNPRTVVAALLRALHLWQAVILQVVTVTAPVLLSSEAVISLVSIFFFSASVSVVTTAFVG